MNPSRTDTIVALSTPPGVGGMAVIRISGPDAVSIIKKIFQGSGDRKTGTSHQAVHGWIMDRKEPVDEVVVTVFRSPRSYTGEDVVEVSCHGGRYISSRIIDLMVGAGARPARPGEFTQRAFLNGKMDLAQAEAVADLIHARTEASRRVAVYQLEGRLSEKLSHMRDQLIHFCGLLEVELDFTEEDISFASRKDLIKQLSSIREELNRLIQSYERGRVCREGIHMVIAGRPNVGKSSLLNALVERERAIVTDIPGTTRDTIEDVLDIEGLLFRITDTAGIRETDDPLEKEGIRRMEGALGEAALILLVCDASQSLSSEDFALFKKIQSLNKPVVVVLNKSDLRQKIGCDDIENKITGQTCLHVSALKKEGLDSLIEALQKEALSGGVPHEGEVVLTRARHRDSLLQTRILLEKAGNSLSKNMSQEFIAMDLRGAMNALGEVTGQTTTDDILEAIFSTFCIGK